MEAQEKQEAVNHLNAAAVDVQRADALFRSGDLVCALQALQQAYEENEQAVAALLRGFLGEVLSATLYADTQQREAYLPELIRLLSFSAAALCPDCRRVVGEEIRAATMEAP